jgi:glyoxylase I family protein
VTKLHHAAICVTDVERSLRFWRDGLGFEVQMDATFQGDWPTLFGAPEPELRSIFLGAPDSRDAGVVELVVMRGAGGDDGPSPAPSAPPASGFFLLSVYADVDATLARLADLGVGGDARVIDAAPGVRLAVVFDPDGIMVELMDRSAEANLDSLAD